MKNLISHFILFIILSLACLAHVGIYKIEHLLYLVPICFIVSLISLVYEECKEQKNEVKKSNN
jgi:hypothetical protein